MRSILIFALAILTIFSPMLTIAGPDEIPGVTLVTMDITGMT